jgi:hypothetical protein
VHFFVDDRGRRPGCTASLVFDRSSASGSVVFDGDQSPKFIDIVTNQPSFPGTIRNIEIHDYMNGITVTRTDSRMGQRIRPAATRSLEAGGAQGLSISNNLFKNLGNSGRHPGTGPTGWGAIVLHYSGNNRVKGNRFEGLGNAENSPLMHALYLVGSGRNTIASNYFGAMDGAVIKLRDRSNDNRIANNVFRFGGEPLLQLWFCNQGIRGKENCAVNECPSIGTEFTTNRIIRSNARDRTRRGGGPIPVTNPFVSYESSQGLRLVERYYVARGVPKNCAVSGAGDKVIRSNGRNQIQRAN